MANAQSVISEDVIDEFGRLSQSVNTPIAAKRLWERILTPADRQQLESLEKAFQNGGTVGMWMRPANMSAERAVIEVALRLGFTDQETANWLLRELGEPELGVLQIPSADRPQWEKEARELRFLGKVVRKVNRMNSATNIVAILDTFQLENWPTRIDDPLPKRRDSKRLHRAIEVLNKLLDPSMRFHADGTGEGVTWSHEDADTSQLCTKCLR